MSAEDAALLHAVASAIEKARPDPAAPSAFGVAVSGGGDSMALLHLAHRVAPGSVRAVTVDHGLRPESAAEAAGVAAFCAALGIPHTTLRWSGPEPRGNLMDQARRARLALMADWARGQGVGHLLLGHTADDQAESFLMNLSRAAGLDGLAGMRAEWLAAGIHWHRPLLGAGRESLRAYLRRHGVTWVEDPSNENDRFTRVKARRALMALRPLGITPDRLALTAAHLAGAQQVLAVATHDAAVRLLSEGAGAMGFPLSGLLTLAPEVQRRLIIALVRWMGGGAYAPRESQVKTLQTALAAGRDAMLAGVRFRQRAGQVTVCREARAVMGAVPFGTVWDHRWQVTGPGAAGMTIAALGPDGLRQCPDWRAHGPRDALVATPAVWQDGRLVAAPLARAQPDWQARFVPSLGMFILSH